MAHVESDLEMNTAVVVKWICFCNLAGMLHLALSEHLHTHSRNALIYIHNVHTYGCRLEKRGSETEQCSTSDE